MVSDKIDAVKEEGEMMGMDEMMKGRRSDGGRTWGR
jgi:hypothetical protein